MKPAAPVLAEYAANLRYDDIPEAVLARSRQCIADTLGACVLGSSLPWGRMVEAHARRHGAGGTSRIAGSGTNVHAPAAALANGVFAHGFELDSLRQPGAGVHPGASLVPALLAVGESVGASGRDVLVAFVAGCEVLFRIGAATHHSSEARGFHAPGLTGPFGAAIAAGRLLKLDAAQLGNALGIAGSFCAGLLAFNHAQQGSMVKRLHLGRAAEAGVVAASLASEGYEGPDTVLEGRHGFLETFCERPEAGLLTRGLGAGFETLRICLKRYACHITAHTPVQSVSEMREEGGFDGRDVATITVRAGPKVLAQHANRDPRDVMEAQYSVPFCAAIALYDDPLDPLAFSERSLKDAGIREAARRLALEPLPEATRLSSWSSEVIVRLTDGREFARTADTFKGTPATPMSMEELRAKFMRCTAGFGDAERLFEQALALERVSDVRELAIADRAPLTNVSTDT
ncbi:MAG TPA: MmgE/PrpD family protein [Usitatibacter sp.]|nr:MmgE/PrpD family protein [Usitatibacter sp.]